MNAAPVSVTLDGVVRRFKGGFELRIPHLEVPAGEAMALLGPSGAGKSTLLAIAGLLERPDEGRVLIDGTPRGVGDRSARMTISAVFQRPYLLKATVADNVAYGLKVRRIPAADIKTRVAEALERVGLSGFGDRSPATLSGGEAQRVALARALVLEPRVLLLDEPLVSLDPILKRQMQREFASILREQGITTLYVTHDPDEALVVADHIAILDRGEMIADGVAEEVVGAPPDEWTARFLGVEPPLSGSVTRSDEGMLTIRCGEVDIVAIGDFEPGTDVRVGLRPEDVILVSPDEPMPLSSARNVLSGTVVEAVSRGATWHVVVDVGGARLAATVSRAAAAELGIAPRVSVRLLFKATALRVISEGHRGR